MTTYRTKWGSDDIEISGNFSEASCPVAGTNGRQVADFSHRPASALRYALEREAVAEGLDIEADDVEEMIENAVSNMKTID